MIAPIQWFGGKGNHKKFILDNLATAGKCDVFVDAFGGAGNIILNRKPAPCEVYNDLNGYLVNMYRVLRDPELVEKLEGMIAMTLYSRAEFAEALRILKENPACPEKPSVLLAWAMFTAYNQGFGGKANAIGDWGRARNSERGMPRNVSIWKTRQGMFEQWHERISRCQIDNRPAIDVCKNFDSPGTLHYLDPPYPLDTRKGEGYLHEMSNDDHQALADWAKQTQGKVAISTYEHPIYEGLLQHGWRKVRKQVSSSFGNHGDGNGANSRKNNPNLYTRIECIYMNWDYQLEVF